MVQLCGRRGRDRGRSGTNGGRDRGPGRLGGQRRPGGLTVQMEQRSSQLNQPSTRANVTYTHFNLPGEVQVNNRTVEDRLNSLAYLAASRRQNQFQWTGTPAVTENPPAAIRGQNQPRPLSNFPSHALVLIGDVWYDPSCGRIYNSLADFEDRAILGYVLELTLTEAEVSRRLTTDPARPVRMDLNQNGVLNELDRVTFFAFRRKQNGQHDLIAQ